MNSMKLGAMTDTGEQRKTVRQLLVIAVLLAVGYACLRTLRFSNDALNLAFVCAFLAIPLFAISPVRQLPRWPRVLTTIILVPLLALSAMFFVAMASCDIPAHLNHVELTRQLSTVQQGRYSVHLVKERTAGGAVGPHWVSLEQRLFIVPGLYVVKGLDSFDEVDGASLSAEGAGKVKLHVPENSWRQRQEFERVYTLKPWVYF